MSNAISLAGLGRDPAELLNDVEGTLRLAEVVEDVARHVARNLSDRYAIIRNINASLPSSDIFSTLRAYWEALVPYYDPKVDVEEHALALTLAFAKLERNLIAGLFDFQHACRQLLFRLSSFTRIEEARYFTVQAILTQLLSNLVSPVSSRAEHQAVADGFLELYLSGDREADVNIRLLDSQDAKVNTATLHLLSNLTRGSPERTEKLLQPTGIAWLSRIISHLDAFHSSSTDQGQDRRFELATALLTSYIPLNLHGRLFANLASPDEPISPSQTVYLKIIDSHIHSTSDSDDGDDADNPNVSEGHVKEGSGAGVINNRFLLPTFHLLSAYSAASIRSAPDDARLPKVFEALHLVCEILCAVGLRTQARRDRLEARQKARTSAAPSRETEEAPGIGTRDGFEGSDEDMVVEMRDPERGVGIVKPIVETLQQLEILLPRSNPRTARMASASPPSASSPSDDPACGSAAPAGGAAPSVLTPDQVRPIAALKRVLVQLLGVLSFSSISVGDQVRECGGVQLILGMTEVDENNPYLREHALFTVRNLMQNNPENQAVIAQMDPVGVLSESGEVLPVPERMRERHAQQQQRQQQQQQQ